MSDEDEATLADYEDLIRDTFGWAADAEFRGLMVDERRRAKAGALEEVLELVGRQEDAGALVAPDLIRRKIETKLNEEEA